MGAQFDFITALLRVFGQVTQSVEFKTTVVLNYKSTVNIIVIQVITKYIIWHLGRVQQLSTFIIRTNKKQFFSVRFYLCFNFKPILI